LKPSGSDYKTYRLTTARAMGLPVPKTLPEKPNKLLLSLAKLGSYKKSL